MALPSSYLTSSKNLEAIIDSLKSAQAPDKLTIRFLENLGFKSSSDRLIINVLKGLGFLTEDSSPTSRYFEFLDQTKSDQVLADGIREAYTDLFQININAHEMTKTEVKNKFKTLTEGRPSADVLDKMAMTFIALVNLADFSSPLPQTPDRFQDEDSQDTQKEEEYHFEGTTMLPSTKLGNLVYNIQIVLPETRDKAIYDAIFLSLREHLG